MSKIISYESVELIENALKKEFGDGGYPLLDEGMKYSLFAGGKRIRPIIMLEMFKLFSDDVEIVLPFAAAIEMIHTYSLIHDDLPCMDDDDTRRGKATNHVVFGYANAVLAGDGLLNLAFERIINSISSENTLEAAKVISKASGRRGMVSGQSADLFFETKKAELSDLKYIHENKTTALLRACFEAGAILGDADKEQICSAIEMGEAFGSIFQLTDDLLDKYGDSTAMGKTLGKDEKNFKSSALIILGEKKTRELIQIEKEKYEKAFKLLNKESAFFKSLVCDVIDRSN